MFFEVLQVLGALLLFFSYFPQILQVKRTKRTQDISFNFLRLLFTSNCIFVIYSLYLIITKDTGYSLVVTNLLVTFSLGYLMLTVIKERVHEKRKTITKWNWWISRSELLYQQKRKNDGLCTWYRNKRKGRRDSWK